jgi:hypothetical protein
MEAVVEVPRRLKPSVWRVVMGDLADWQTITMSER